MKIKIILLLLSLGFGNLTIKSQVKIENQQTVDIDKTKMKLSEYLLSCQSMYYTILKEKDFQKQVYLANIGTDYYNKAYKEWVALQDPANGELSEDLKKTISGALKSYEQVFRETDKLNDARNAIALQIIESWLKKTILPELWDKK